MLPQDDLAVGSQTYQIVAYFIVVEPTMAGKWLELLKEAMVLPGIPPWPELAPSEVISPSSSL
jgi:hypothetical protein